MTTSLVIPAWCWNDSTLALLTGAMKNVRDTSDVELVVVYAGLHEGEALASRADRWITVNPPQGWAAASNIGLLAATGDYLAVGSDDVRVPQGWLPKLLAAAGEDGIASPLDFKNGRQRSWDATYRGSFWGAFFLFPRRVLDEIGYLDGYAMRRYADMDWAIRARKAGFRTTRADVRARHVAPHHTIYEHGDRHDHIVREDFRARHEGHERLGSWELEG